MTRKDDMTTKLLAGASLQIVADEYGISKARVGQIVGTGVANANGIKLEHLRLDWGKIIKRLLHGETKQSLQKEYGVSAKNFNREIGFDAFIKENSLRRCYRHSSKNTPEYVKTFLFTPSGLRAGICRNCQREKQTEWYQAHKGENSGK